MHYYLRYYSIQDPEVEWCFPYFRFYKAVKTVNDQIAKIIPYWFFLLKWFFFKKKKSTVIYAVLYAVLRHFSCIWHFMTPWTVALQAPLSMGFSRQEYRRGLPHPPPGDLPDSGMEPASLTSPALAGGFFTTWATWEMEVKVLVAQSYLTLCEPMDCIAWQAPLSMDFSSQEYWSELPFPSPGDLPSQGIKPRSPALQAVWAMREATWEMDLFK